MPSGYLVLCDAIECCGPKVYPAWTGTERVELRAAEPDAADNAVFRAEIDSQEQRERAQAASNDPVEISAEEAERRRRAHDASRSLIDKLRADNQRALEEAKKPCNQLRAEERIAARTRGWLADKREEQGPARAARRLWLEMHWLLQAKTSEGRLRPKLFMPYDHIVVPSPDEWDAAFPPPGEDTTCLPTTGGIPGLVIFAEAELDQEFGHGELRFVEGAGRGQKAANGLPVGAWRRREIATVEEAVRQELVNGHPAIITKLVETFRGKYTREQCARRHGRYSCLAKAVLTKKRRQKAPKIKSPAHWRILRAHFSRSGFRASRSDPADASEEAMYSMSTLAGAASPKGSHGATDNALTPPSLAGDLLEGAEEIAEFMFGTRTKKAVRKVF